MASVQMSQTLREQILDNYKIQLQKNFRQEYKVDEAVEQVINSMQSDREFNQVLHLNVQYTLLAEELNKRYSSGSSYNSTFRTRILEPRTELGIICNPTRDIKSNLSYIKDWQYPYTDRHADEFNDKKCSDNYVEGDVAISLENLDEFYSPFKTQVVYQSWRAQQDYAPYAETALLITDPALCDIFSPIGTIEQKVGDALETLEKWLNTVTTLKKFLDELSGGLSLVPQEYIDRYNTKNAPKSRNVSLPVDAIPEGLKNSLNEVILENKLLGD